MEITLPRHKLVCIVTPIGSVHFTWSAHLVGFSVPNQRQPNTLLTQNRSLFLSFIVLMTSVDLSFVILRAPKFLNGLPMWHVVLISRSMWTHLGNLSTYLDFKVIASYLIVFAILPPYLFYL